MSTIRRKYGWNRIGSSKDTMKINAPLNYYFPREIPKIKPSNGLVPVPSGPVQNRPIFLQNRSFQPPNSHLRSIRCRGPEKPCNSYLQKVNLSFKMSDKCRMEKGEIFMNSEKRTFINANSKPPLRITSGNVGPVKPDLSVSERPVNGVSEKTKISQVPELPSDNISKRNSLNENKSNASEDTVKIDRRNTLSPPSKKRKAEDETDRQPVIKTKKKVDPKKKVWLVGKAISLLPSTTGPSNEAVGPRNKNSRRVVCSSRLTAVLNRNSEWEKMALKSRSLFLKHRSQKMLKDRLEKYCVTARKPNMGAGEGLSSKEANEASSVPPLTIEAALPKFGQDSIVFRPGDLNKKNVEQSSILGGNSETTTNLKKSTPGTTYSTTSQISKKPPPPLPKIPPPVAVSKNVRKATSVKNNVVKEPIVMDDLKDAAEMEVKKEVESLVEKAILQTSTITPLRNSKDLRRNRNDSVQEGLAVGVTKDDIKLKKMWALVAEETSLMSSLDDLIAKMNKLKEELCTLSSESFQITRRLEEVRIFKNQLLSNSQG